MRLVFAAVRSASAPASSPVGEPGCSNFIPLLFAIVHGRKRRNSRKRRKFRPANAVNSAVAAGAILAEFYAFHFGCDHVSGLIAQQALLTARTACQQEGISGRRMMRMIWQHRLGTKMPGAVAGE